MHGEFDRTVYTMHDIRVVVPFRALTWPRGGIQKCHEHELLDYLVVCRLLAYWTEYLDQDRDEELAVLHRTVNKHIPRRTW